MCKIFCAHSSESSKRSCREWNCSVYFSSARNQRIYWFKFEVAQPFKNKGRAKSGPLFPWKNKVLRQSVQCKEWHHFWTTTTMLGSRLDFFFVGARLPSFFSPLAVCCCVCITWMEFINIGKTSDKTKFQTLFLAKTSSPCRQVTWQSSISNIMLDGKHSQCCIILQ